MRDNITLGIALCAFALSGWNFWKTHWGKTPAYALRIEHRDAGNFLVRNVGRRRLTIVRAHLRPFTDTTLPKEVFLEPTAAVPFTFELSLSDTKDWYPDRCEFTVIRAWPKWQKRLVVPMPFAAEARDAVRRKAKPVLVFADEANS